MENYGKRFKDAFRHDEYIGNRVYYWKRITSIEGCWVTLFREGWHTKEDIKWAKFEARRSWDVVGINIVKVINTFQLEG